MFLLERKQQMLIFFWSSSSELWAIRERFLLAGTKRTFALDPIRGMVVQRRLWAELQLLLTRRPAWWARGTQLLHRLPSPGSLPPHMFPNSFPIPPLLQRYLTCLPSDAKPLFCKFLEFLSDWLPVLTWVEIFKDFIVSRADFPYCRLVWDRAHSSRKPRVGILKQNAIIHSVGRLSWFPYKCGELHSTVHLSGMWNTNGKVIFMSLYVLI